MIKKELVLKASQKTNVDTKDVEKVLNAVMEVISDEILADNEVYLRGFGTFKTKTRKEKIGQNISRGTALIIPEHKIPFWNPSSLISKELKEKTKID